MMSSQIKRAAACLLVSFLAIHILVLWNVRDRVAAGFPDYTIFYTAATMVRRGMAADLYNSKQQYGIQRDVVPAARNGRGLLPYNHPPFEAVLFVPFTYLPYLAGYVIWGMLNYIFLGVALWLIQPYLPSLPRLQLVPSLALAAGVFPVFASLFEGQDSILILLLYGLAFRDWKQKRLLRSGIWLGLSLFKFQLVLPFVAIAILTRHWKPVFGFFLSAIGMLIASIAVVGWRTALQYPFYIQHLEKSTAGGAIVGVTMPNLHGLVEALLPGTVNPIIRVVAVAILSVLVIVVAARTIDKDGSVSNENLCFALAVLVTVLVSYHCFAYDWTVLLLPALLSFNHLASVDKITSWSERLLLGAAVAFFLSPVYLVPFVRSGRLFGLAVLLLFWCWALAAEIRASRLPKTFMSFDDRLDNVPVKA